MNARRSLTGERINRCQDRPRTRRQGKYVNLGRTPLAALLLFSAVSTLASAQEGPPRVILFIVDGGGVGHWSVAQLAVGDDLAVRQFPVVGLVDTRGANHLITESGAGATALATGVRTFYGAVGLGPDSVPVKTVLELSIDLGMATGLVTTGRLTDATPAAFATHIRSRRYEWEIARRLALSNITVLLGGGRASFTAADRPDSMDLITPLKERYTYVETAAELEALEIDTVDALFGLFAAEDMPIYGQRAPSLAAMMSAALAVVDKDSDGFFLLVENEQTDTQAHDNASVQIIAAEMYDVDEAIRRGLEYQRKHPETLLVVVADHETGGLNVQADSAGRLVARYTTGNHTTALVPLFASGPGAEQFGGIIDNSKVGQLLLAAVASGVRAIVDGRVLDDSTSMPIAGAEVTLIGDAENPDTTVVTDRDGRFVLSVRPGMFVVQVLRIGYAPTFTPEFTVPESLEPIDLRVLLPSQPLMLDPIVVTGVAEPLAPGPLQGFTERKRRGWGLFLTRKDFEARSPTTLTQILDNLPGGRPMYACPPSYYVDGVLTDEDLAMRQVLASEVEAVEVYRRASETPIDFLNMSNALCGVVVVWTKRGPRTNP